MGVREALSDLRANAEPSRAPVLKVNVRDARDSLRRRVNQISPETSARQVTSCLCPHMQYWHQPHFLILICMDILFWSRFYSLTHDKNFMCLLGNVNARSCSCLRSFAVPVDGVNHRRLMYMCKLNAGQFYAHSQNVLPLP